MLLIKLLPAFLLIELISSLSIVEDKVLNNHLMEVFGDYTDEIKDDIVKIKESSASAESSKDEKRFVSIIAPVQSRADHYWTRKRGREKATLPADQTKSCTLGIRHHPGHCQLEEVKGTERVNH